MSTTPDLPPLPEKRPITGQAGLNCVTWGKGHDDSTLEAYAREAVRLALAAAPTYAGPAPQASELVKAARLALPLLVRDRDSLFESSVNCSTGRVDDVGDREDIDEYDAAIDALRRARPPEGKT